MRPEVLQAPEAQPATAALRARILAFEAALAHMPGAVQGDSDHFPLRHAFGDGVYVREITIPAGSLLTGKIHKQAHPVFLMRGALRLLTEGGGYAEVRAPHWFIAPPGAKRAAFALEETVWVTVHATQATALEAIEAEVIAPDFAAYDAYRAALAASTVPAPLGEGDAP